MSLLRLTSVALLHSTSLSAYAETAPIGTGVVPQSRIFKAILATSQLETLVIEGRRQDLALHLQVECTERMQVHPLRLVPLKPIDMPDDQANPVSGAWQIRHDLIRCGESRRYNVISVADPRGGKPTVAARLPGDSLASLQLVRDAMSMTIGLANAEAGEGRCPKVEQVLTADMKVDEPPHRVVEGDHVFENVWTETWTFDVCGHPIVASMRFVPNASDGGTDWTVDFPTPTPSPSPHEP